MMEAKDVYAKELEDCIQTKQHRLQMKENLQVDPVMDTFDLLDLQETHLRQYQINRKGKMK